MSNSSYVRSQDPTRLFPDETYTTSCWINNTTRAGLPASPWCRAPLSRSIDKTNTAYFKAYTVGQLLSGTGASITGVNSNESVWSILNGAPKVPSGTPGVYTTGTSSCGEFQKLMLVAWLNFKVLNSTLNKCLAPGATNVLVKFGNCSYVDPTGATWTQAKVVTYLKKNFVACADESCA